MRKVNQYFPLESTFLTDEETGRRVRQVTNAQAITHHPFFLAPCFDEKQRWLCMVTFRTGQGQIMLEDQRQQCLRIVTNVCGLDEWSLSVKDEWIYFVADGQVWRVLGENGESELLLSERDVRSLAGSEAFMADGTTAVTKSGRYLAVRVKTGEKGYAILIRDNKNGQWANVCTCPVATHVQFCPDDDDLLFFAGPLTDRPWVLHWPSGQAKLIYHRNAAAKQWITHESWIPGTREMSLVDWPHGVLAVHVDTGAVRRVTDWNAWHAICSDDGTRMVFDTNFPDRGVYTLDPRICLSTPEHLCSPHASCMGEHWAGAFPYDHGPIKVYAPQHTHPHPRFSPDGKRIVFTSDYSGIAQVYEMNLP